MSTYETDHYKRGHGSTDVRHSKADALSDREFELLLEGATQMDDYYGKQAEFVILVLGRLGLRRGELTHLQRDWIDWRQEMIEIPLHEDCHGQKNGDGVCGYCTQLAEQKAARNPDLTEEVALANQWEAKTPAAARGVYFGFDARLRLHIERFFENYDEWQWSPMAITRRVKRAAEHADELAKEDVRPHSLRAMAATHHAGRGLELSGLMQMMGWAQASTAEVYLARNSQNTARQLDAIHQG